MRSTDRQEGVESNLSSQRQAAMASCRCARMIGLADARRLAASVMLDVAEGKDPVERKAERDSGTFADLAPVCRAVRYDRHGP